MNKYLENANRNIFPEKDFLCPQIWLNIQPDICRLAGYRISGKAYPVSGRIPNIKNGLISGTSLDASTVSVILTKGGAIKKQNKKKLTMA